MTLEETKHLLRTYRIIPNKILGQNFMVEPSLYPKLCNYASLGYSDVVLDAGSGFGFLSRFLADKCKAVVAVEKDPQVAKALRERVRDIANVSVIEGDVLKTALPKFNKVIAIPPYYLSTRLITWLIKRKIDSAVLIVQREFANRLTAPVGSEDYGWLTVMAYQRFEAVLFDAVPKSMFYPQPEVDSIIVRLKPWTTPQFLVKNEAFFTQMTKWLFTQRNKKLAKALTPFVRSALKLSKENSEIITLSMPFREKRVRELSPEAFGELADAIQH